MKENERLGIFAREYLPQSFFAPMASSRKDFNVDFFYFLYSRLEKTAIDYKIEKNRFREMMDDFILESEEYGEDFRELKSNGDGRASFITSRLTSYKNSGWIQEEYDISGTKTVILSEHIITILKWLSDVRNHNKKPLTSSVKSIKNNLLSSDLDYNLLMSIKDDCKTLRNDMSVLASGMKDIIVEMVNESSVAEIANTLIVDVQSPYFTDYKKLKCDDNICKYRLSIMERLRELGSDTGEVLTNIVVRYVDEVSGDLGEEEKKTEIEQRLYMLSQVIDNMFVFFQDTYDELIGEIEKERLRYLNMANERLAIINKHDESDLAKVQKLISWGDSYDVPCESLLNLFSFGILSQEGCRRKVEKKKKEGGYKIKRGEMTEEERKKITKDIAESKSKFSEKMANVYMEELLGTNSCVATKDLMVSSEDELTMLGVMPIYLGDNSDKYIIEKDDGVNSTPYGAIKNYILRKRGA